MSASSGETSRKSDRFNQSMTSQLKSDTCDNDVNCRDGINVNGSLHYSTNGGGSVIVEKNNSFHLDSTNNTASFLINERTSKDQEMLDSDSSHTKHARNFPKNQSEVMIYKILERANLLCYFETFVQMGGDDVHQLCDADDEEFLEIMDFVGMTKKPLHVRRLQKTLIEWKKNPDSFDKIVSMNAPNSHKGSLSDRSSTKLELRSSSRCTSDNERILLPDNRNISSFKSNSMENNLINDGSTRKTSETSTIRSEQCDGIKFEMTKDDSSVSSPNSLESPLRNDKNSLYESNIITPLMSIPSSSSKTFLEINSNNFYHLPSYLIPHHQLIASEYQICTTNNFGLNQDHQNNDIQDTNSNNVEQHIRNSGPIKKRLNCPAIDVDNPTFAQQNLPTKFQQARDDGSKVSASLRAHKKQDAKNNGKPTVYKICDVPMCPIGLNTHSNMLMRPEVCSPNNRNANIIEVHKIDVASNNSSQSMNNKEKCREPTDLVISRSRKSGSSKTKQERHSSR